MGANKTQSTKASVTAFIAALTDPLRQADAKALSKLMARASGEKAVMWGTSIIGFGAEHYKYESGREGDTVLVGFSPRKSALVLYGLRGGNQTEALLAKLGPHKTEKGCIYIKKLADVDAAILEKLIASSVAAKRPSKG